jgi:hypothetical protein
MTSAQYRHLRKQIAALRTALLPRDLNVDLSKLTPRLSIRALAFRVLSHAEFENYLESRATEISTTVDRAWRTRKLVTYSTLCMIGFSGVEMRIPPEAFEAPANKRQTDWSQLVCIDDRLNKAITAYYYFVTQQNNGIKENNLVRLLIPLGFDISTLDELFVAEIDNFGTLRGSAAHQSCAGQIQSGVHPKDEHAVVKRLLQGVLPIDTELSRILKLAG